jgi:glycolate oxidase
MTAVVEAVAVDLARQHQVATALRAFLPQASVLFDAEDVRPYECDGLSAYRQVPMVVALPENEAQVQRIVKTCHELRVPVVARGAGTGLSGGALPLGNGVLLSLARLMRVLEVDGRARTARVQPGVRNLAISETVAHLGLYYAPDPSSQIACSIGGNVAENSGGVHCLKYGLTVHNILKLRVVTAEGDIVEIGGDGLDAAGYDLLALMTGSEGLLGIVTEITVKLLPKPENAQCVLAAFDDVEKAGAAVASIIAAGIIPAGLEMMDQAATMAVEHFVHAGYPTDVAGILLCESDGTREEVADEIARVREIMEKNGAILIRVSQNDAERLKFWAGRKAAFPAVGRLSPDYYCMDGTIPRQRLSEVLGRITEMEKRYGLRCANVFHAGDGNLHPLMLTPHGDAAAKTRAQAAFHEIIAAAIELGGTVTGEHGVGLLKRAGMQRELGPGVLALQRAVKQALDPDGILNPGKVVG